VANRSKARGTSFESLIRDYLQHEWSPDIDRLPLSGRTDRGDIGNFRVGGRLVAVECKRHSRMDLGTWVFEAQREAEAYGAFVGVVVHKRRGKGRAGDQYVTLTLEDFVAVLAVAGGERGNWCPSFTSF
jgi:hypothetical protein